MKLTDEQIARVKSMENARGGITPDAVVEDARQKSSPLHPLFDWDKSRAAQKWWLEVAREVIRAVEIVTVTTTVTVSNPYYVRDPDASGQGYRSVVALRRDPVSARQALIDELTRAAGSVTRARDLAVPLGLESEVDALLARIMGLQRKIPQAA